MTIVIATRNRYKFRELTDLLKVPGIRWRSLREVPQITSIPETGLTFDTNAIKKARAVARATGGFALADDSGIEVDALNGAPGVRSARFATVHGNDRANNEKLLRLLRQVPLSRRGAQYRCSLALASPSRVLALTRGLWRGKIAQQPKGRGGFGYDPIFLVPHYGKTVGQLSAHLKHRLSHRAQAARRMRPILLHLEATARRRRVAARARLVLV